MVAAKRTPFCAFGGKFVNINACDLQTIAAKAALSAGKVMPDIVDSVIIGNVLGVNMILNMFEQLLKDFSHDSTSSFLVYLKGFTISSSPCTFELWHPFRPPCAWC